jgi:hypothetical protein
MHPVTVCSECHEPINARDIKIEIGPDWIGEDEFGI